MSQKLCEEFRKEISNAEVGRDGHEANYYLHLRLELIARILVEILYCHHEEKKGCKICNDPSYLYEEGEIISDGKVDTIEVKFCPNCGRKL